MWYLCSRWRAPSFVLSTRPHTWTFSRSDRRQTDWPLRARRPSTDTDWPLPDQQRVSSLTAIDLCRWRCRFQPSPRSTRSLCGTTSIDFGELISVDLAGILRGTHGERRRWVGAKWGGVWWGCPLSSQLGGLWERCELPHRGPGQNPDRKRILVYFEGHRTLLFVSIWQKSEGTNCTSVPLLQILRGTCPPHPPVIYAHGPWTTSTVMNQDFDIVTRQGHEVTCNSNSRSTEPSDVNKEKFPNPKSRTWPSLSWPRPRTYLHGQG